ncbi:MAG: WecB/TagA/CpsF family glycosyltransferase [Clostridiales bacterium]|nr:WecB/TagA/CpsF family glycosyltransferase [Clostridiales bacterium]
MRKITHVLQVPFDVVTMDEAIEKAYGFFDEIGQHIICTPNPEIVMEAQEDRELMEILKAADLVIPDGIGVVWASKYSEKKLTERVPGYDLTQRLFQKMKDDGKKVYLFGGAPQVAQAAAKKMMNKYPGLQIVGTHNGYFNEKEEKMIICDIKKKAPDLLLVGLGAPKQEKWIYDNMRFTGAKVCIGVGGSFDVMAGNVKRAPKFFRRFGLEWFYRLVSQPSRWRRMLRLPRFVLKVWMSRG